MVKFQTYTLVYNLAIRMVNRLGTKFPGHEISISQIQTNLISLSIAYSGQSDLASFSSEVERLVANMPVKDTTVRATCLDRIIYRLIEKENVHCHK